MAVRVGDRFPAFSGPTHDGRTLDLSALRGQNLVIFFFPKANTPG
jgi:peroxiredoxin Q/BCP